LYKFILITYFNSEGIRNKNTPTIQQTHPKQQLNNTCRRMGRSYFQSQLT